MEKKRKKYKLIKSKKAMVWSEIAKWIIMASLLIVIIVAIMTPAREALFGKLGELTDILKFG